MLLPSTPILPGGLPPCSLTAPSFRLPAALPRCPRLLHAAPSAAPPPTASSSPSPPSCRIAHASRGSALPAATRLAAVRPVAAVVAAAAASQRRQPPQHRLVRLKVSLVPPTLHLGAGLDVLRRHGAGACCAPVGAACVCAYVVLWEVGWGARRVGGGWQQRPLPAGASQRRQAWPRLRGCQGRACLPWPCAPRPWAAPLSPLPGPGLLMRPVGTGRL